MIQFLHILDIDECTTGVHDCKSNERCVNKPGWFICKCADGYKPVNNTCEGKDLIFSCVRIKNVYIHSDTVYVIYHI